VIFQEVIGSIYPWDLRDEGVEAILDHLQRRASCNMVYLIAVEIGHYEGTTFECLDAIGDGIRQAGVTVAAGP
jgi:hypothetical protein